MIKDTTYAGALQDFNFGGAFVGTRPLVPWSWVNCNKAVSVTFDLLLTYQAVDLALTPWALYDIGGLVSSAVGSSHVISVLQRAKTFSCAVALTNAKTGTVSVLRQEGPILRIGTVYSRDEALLVVNGTRAVRLPVATTQSISDMLFFNLAYLTSFRLWNTSLAESELISLTT